ncbi:hypothetical protein [Moorena sp. SIO3H5]|nr:hypothetical protein [Moorena sp. SIO3H5]
MTHPASIRALDECFFLVWNSSRPWSAPHSEELRLSRNLRA